MVVLHTLNTDYHLFSVGGQQQQSITEYGNCLLQNVSTVQSTDWNTRIKSAQPLSLLTTFESLVTIWYVYLTAMKTLLPLQKLQSNDQSDIFHCPMVF